MKRCFSLLLVLSVSSPALGQVRDEVVDRGVRDAVDRGVRDAVDRGVPAEVDWEAIRRRIEGAVERGDMTREEADARYREFREQLARERGEPDADDSGARDAGDRETRCGMECYEKARAAAVECLQNGGAREQCGELYLHEVGACLEAAGCATLDRRDSGRVDRSPPCGLRCFGAARAAVVGCLESGRARDECGAVYHRALRACLGQAGCDGRGSADDETMDPIVAALVAAPRFLRGDGNGDGRVNLPDAIAILAQLFLGQQGLGCMDAADANDDGAVNISDPFAILRTLFLGPEPLPEPSDERGSDPTPDDLDCFAYGP